MKRYRLAALFALAGICLVVFAMPVSQPPEPVYGGKTVGQWVNEVKVAVGVVRMPGTTLVFPAGMSDQALPGMQASLATNRTAKIIGGGGVSSLLVFQFGDGAGQITAEAYPAVEKDGATEALRAMGQRAVPYLKGQLSRRNSEVAVWYFSFWKKLPTSAREILQPPRSAVAQRAKAAHALGLLGPAAKAAVPELSRLAGNDDVAMVRAVALEAIKRIDPETAATLPNR